MPWRCQFDRLLANSGRIGNPVDDTVLAYVADDGSWRQLAAANVHVVASSEDGRALLLGLADGSVQRIGM